MRNRSKLFKKISMNIRIILNNINREYRVWIMN